MTVATGVRLSDKTVNFVPAGRRVRPLRDQIIIKPVPLALSERLQADWRGETVCGCVVAVGPGCYPNIHRRGFKDGKPYHTVHQSRVFRPTEVKIGEDRKSTRLNSSHQIIPYAVFCLKKKHTNTTLH